MASRTWYFSLHSEWAGRILILTLAGRLTGGSVPRLQDGLAEGQPAGVLVDLSQLDYISGPGLAALENASERSARAGRPFVLCGLEESVRIAFDLAGLLEVVSVETSRDRGLARIAGQPTV